MKRVLASIPLVVWSLVVFGTGLSCSSSAAFADPKEFEDEILAFEEQDRQNPPAPCGIVFSGSSSIRLWDLPRFFPGIDLLNRGFGGSTIADVRYYAQRALLNYRPHLIIFYAGENDIVFGKSANQVLSDFQDLYTETMRALPGVSFVFISVKPSPGRQAYWGEFRELNRTVAAFLKDKPGATFVDIYGYFIGPNGEAQPQYFQDDMHLNDAGYRIWTNAIHALVH